MKLDVCIDVCRTVFSGTKWYLLENGTILYLRDVPQVTDEYVVLAMADLAEAIGDGSGEGSPYGDINPMKLVRFPGWLVAFGAPCGGMITYVGPEEMEGTPPPSPTERFVVRGSVQSPKDAFETRVGIFGRHKRNLDARTPKIVARSTDYAAVFTAEPPSGNAGRWNNE